MPIDFKDQNSRARGSVWQIILTVAFLAAFSYGTYVFATPTASPYAPGEINDPLCAPGTLNCYVSPAVSVSSPLTGDGTSGDPLAIPAATSISDGYLDSSDWVTFNGKQDVLSGSGIVKSTAGTISYVSGASSDFVKGDGSLDSSTYLTGSGTAGQVAYWGLSGVTSDSNFTWDATNKDFSVGVGSVDVISLSNSADHIDIGDTTAGYGIDYTGPAALSAGPIDKGLLISATADTYTLGNTTLANKTYVSVSGTAKQMTVNADNGVIFQDASSSKYLEAHPDLGTYKYGDINGVFNNNTYLFVDDNTKSVKAVADNAFVAQTVAGKRFLMATSNVSTIGDIDTFGNGTYLTLDDGQQKLQFNKRKIDIAGVPYVFPTSDANGVLQDDGSGGLSWLAGPAAVLAAGTSAITSGAANRILFENSANNLGEDANLTWDSAAGILTAGNATKFYLNNTTDKFYIGDTIDGISYAGPASSGGAPSVNGVSIDTVGHQYFFGGNGVTSPHPGGVYVNNALAFENVQVGFPTGSKIDVSDLTSSVTVTTPEFIVNMPSGTCAFGSGATALVCSSDERLKTNVVSLPSSLDAINRLRPVTYNWKNPAASQNQNIGFIAQEMQQVFPQFVSVVDSKTGYLGVNYAGLVVPAIKAIQELDMKVEPLTSIDSARTGSLASLMVQFLQNAVVSIKDATVGTLRIGDKVCADDVCVTKDQFKSMLLQANGTAGH